MITAKEAEAKFIEKLHSAHPELAVGVELGFTAYTVIYMGMDRINGYKFRAKKKSDDLYNCCCACSQNSVYYQLFKGHFYWLEDGSYFFQKCDPESFNLIHKGIEDGTYQIRVSKGNAYYLYGCPWVMRRNFQ